LSQGVSRLMKRKEQIGVVGAGVVGKALAVVLSRTYRVVAVASRTQASARQCAALCGAAVCARPADVARRADVVLLCTPDQAIQPVCEQIAAEGGFRSGHTVVHLSGALPSDLLSAARCCGARALSVHPIQTFADYKEAVEALRGSYFSVEGDNEALSLGKRLVRDMGGRPIIISAESKPLYHAALCVASNYLVTLEALAADILDRGGSPVALPALLPLILGTVRNLERFGVPAALTGPISRGDVATIQCHLDALKRDCPEYLDTYKHLARLTARVADRKGSLKADASEKLWGLLVSNPSVS